MPYEFTYMYILKVLAVFVHTQHVHLSVYLPQPSFHLGAMLLFLNQGQGCLALRMTHVVPWANEDRSHVIALARRIKMR